MNRIQQILCLSLLLLIIPLQVSPKTIWQQLNDEQSLVIQKFLPPAVRVFPMNSTTSSSGFLVSPDGHILTVDSITKQNESFRVLFSDGKVQFATLKGRDQKTGLALLKTEKGTPLFVQLKPSKEPRRGECVLVISNVAQWEGLICSEDVSLIGPGSYAHLIQLTPVLPSESWGSMLVNANSEILGVVLLSDQISTYAVPNKIIDKVLPQLISDGKVTRGFLGVRFAPNKLPDGRETGRVVKVFEGGPAHAAGIFEGDIILELNGQKINSLHGLLLTLEYILPGEKVKLKIQRNGKLITLLVRLGQRPDESSVAVGTKAPDFSLVAFNGKKWLLSDAKGERVILHFWAVWCLPCIEELPLWESLYQRYKDQGVQFISVAMDDDPLRVKEFLREHPVPYPVYRGDKEVEMLYGASLFPLTFLINREGVVTSRLIGVQKEEVLAQAIEEALKDF